MRAKLLAFAAATALCASCQTAEEPQETAAPIARAYAGRTAAEWADFVRAANASEPSAAAADASQEAIDALAALGTESQGPVRSLLEEDSDGVRLIGLMAVRRLGPAAQPLLKDLVPFLRERANRALRVEALRAAGAVGDGQNLLLPEILPQLDDKDAEIRIEAIRAASALAPGGASGELLEALQRLAVRDLNGGVRQAARRALEHPLYELPDRVSPIRM